MARFWLLAALVSLVAASAAPPSPVLTLPLTKHVNPAKLRNLASADRARLRSLLHRGKGDRRDKSVNATNNGVAYVVQVGVGSPFTSYSLIVDTGSSNTWLGAGTAYVQTKSAIPLGQNVSVAYGSGFFDGKEYLDKVTLGPSLVIKDQSIGVADEAFGFDNYDGILGLGPTGLTRFTVSGTDTVPTVIDQLFASSKIAKRVVGVAFAPFDVGGGSISLGRADASKHLGSIKYARVTKAFPSSDYFGIDLRVTYGGAAVLARAPGIVDTGTTLILLASDAYEAYVLATGAVPDFFTGLLSVTPEQYAALEPLVFHVAGRPLALSPNAQIFPRSLNTAIGGDPDAIYLVVADIGLESGSGLDFVLGQSFLERFYSVYDSGPAADGSQGRVGFAATKDTLSLSN